MAGYGFDSLSKRNRLGRSDWPDPYDDQASRAFPDKIATALEWCEFIFSHNGTYREAVRRLVAYFVTDVEIDSDDKDEKDKYSEFLHDQLNIVQVLHDLGMNLKCYGNTFSSLLLPIRRYLMCPRCRKLELPLRALAERPEFDFSWRNWEFHAKCPKCEFRGAWTRIDRRSNDPKEIYLKHWDPHQIDIRCHIQTGHCEYLWRIPEEDRRIFSGPVDKGLIFQLERTNWEVIEAIKRSDNLLFEPNVVRHMRESGLAGVEGKTRGWGISSVLANFRQSWYVQVLHRYNEAIALDYIIPFRVITPAPRSGGEIGDPALNVNMGGLQGQVSAMLRKRRQDPAAWNFLPYPIQYQALGGDARALAPRELLDQGIDNLLNATGIPVEMYKGTLSTQAAPTALRYFEIIGIPLFHQLSKFVQWVADEAARLQGWKPVKVRMQRPSHADDLNKQMAKMSLMASGIISQSSALRTAGLNFEEEQRKLLEEQRFVAREQARMQRELEEEMMGEQLVPPGGVVGQFLSQQQQGGMPGQPGMPGMAGGAPAGPAGAAPPAGAAGPMGPVQPMPSNIPTTPEDMMQQADSEAQQMLGMPYGQRRQRLQELKRSSPELHMLVTGKLREHRQSAASQGQQQVLQQQYGQPQG